MEQQKKNEVKTIGFSIGLFVVIVVFPSHIFCLHRFPSILSIFEEIFFRCCCCFTFLFVRSKKFVFSLRFTFSCRDEEGLTDTLCHFNLIITATNQTNQRKKKQQQQYKHRNEKRSKKKWKEKENTSIFFSDRFLWMCSWFKNVGGGGEHIYARPMLEISQATLSLFTMCFWIRFHFFSLLFSSFVLCFFRFCFSIRHLFF